jgi:hypothetical protein
MNELQKMGGVGALVNAAAYTVGLALAFTLLMPVLESEPDQFVALLVDNQTLLYTWHLIIYLVAGVFMVPMVLGLHDRLKDGSPALMQNTTAFGLIWAALVIASGMVILVDIGTVVDLYANDPAQAVTIWLAVDSVERGLGGGIELPGGIWVLLLSWAALRSGGLPNALNYLGLLIGLAGIVTIVPMLGDIGGTIFGLGFILWFAWVGIVLLRNGSGSARKNIV